MRGDGLYRLSAWVRVVRVGKATPMPYLKCEFVAADTSLDLGHATTERYDGARTGTWQELVCEFRAPKETEACWIALEKGGRSAMEIDARLDDVTLEPISRMTGHGKYVLDPVPAALLSVRNQRPRIYLDAARIAALRQAIEGSHASLWAEVKARAERSLERGAPEYREDDGRSGDEQLWQRGVGNAMPFLAMAYVLTGEEKYLAGAREWALASCGYPTWGLGRIDGMDLATGHQLFGLGIVYDWCYGDFDEETRRVIRETLTKRTSAMFEAAASGRAWWRRSYLQNHLWVNICGMSVAGFALYGEVDDALLWIGLPLDKFRRTMDALGDDGASHEGVGYWGYGVEYMLKFMDLARSLLGVEMYDHPWWRNTADYRLYLSLPRGAWTRRSNVVDIADCPRGNWYGPDYLLRRLAGEYRDGVAQWLAGEVDRANVDSPEARWLNLVWHDEALQEKPPGTKPSLRHFADMDIVSARSGWGGGESLVVLKCGPYIGHEAMEAFSYDPGGGHVHPDANHFVLFGNGEWLIRDDGYRAKWTGQHNTLLVAGRGQLGEGRKWFRGTEPLALKARPRIVRAESTADLDWITGDATEAYPRDIGLQRYERHLLYLKPNVLIVVDDVKLDTPAELELRFHPEQESAEGDGGVFLLRGDRAVLRVEPLEDGGTGPDIRASAEEVPTEGRRGEDESMFTIRVVAVRRDWRNAVALSWAPAGGEPATVTCRGEGDRWVFAAGDRTVALDWSSGRAEVAQ